MSVTLDIGGSAAPPRRNGELAFDAPWQSGVFALTAGLVESRFGGDWQPFRRHLMAAIAAEPDRPYWESWTAALEDFVAAARLLAPGAADERVGG